MSGARGLARPPPRLSDPAASAEDSGKAMLAAADEILAVARYLERGPPAPLHPPPPAQTQGVIHPLMADQREMQAIALQGTTDGHEDRLAALTAAARRLVEAHRDPTISLALHRKPATRDRAMVGILQNDPLWPHARDGFQRDGGKLSLPLWGRKQPPRLARAIGVFLHLHYDELAPVFAERLAALAVPHRIHVSTDSPQKAERIRASLPDAEIRVMQNRGRDIWPKLYGFADAHDRHDIVLHLHGKKSTHSDRLNDWLDHILNCLTASTQEMNRILSFFQTIPSLGLVVPVTYRAVLGAAHWGANRGIARELARRMDPPPALPQDNALRFPVGSMFWARTAALRPVLDLRLQPGHFPPEAGQVDGTTAHALERLLGVACLATGHHILPVSGGKARLHVKYQRRFTSNRDLRAALENGTFDA